MRPANRPKRSQTFFDRVAAAPPTTSPIRTKRAVARYDQLSAMIEREQQLVDNVRGAVATMASAEFERGRLHALSLSRVLIMALGAAGRPALRVINRQLARLTRPDALTRAYGSRKR